MLRESRAAVTRPNVEFPKPGCPNVCPLPSTAFATPPQFRKRRPLHTGSIDITGYVGMTDIQIRRAPLQLSSGQRKIGVVDFVRSVVNRMRQRVMHLHRQPAGEALFKRSRSGVIVAVIYRRIQVDIPNWRYSRRCCSGIVPVGSITPGFPWLKEPPRIIEDPSYATCAIQLSAKLCWTAKFHSGE
jgi:hypothetical protein